MTHAVIDVAQFISGIGTSKFCGFSAVGDPLLILLIIRIRCGIVLCQDRKAPISFGIVRIGGNREVACCLFQIRILVILAQRHSGLCKTAVLHQLQLKSGLFCRVFILQIHDEFSVFFFLCDGFLIKIHSRSNLSKPFVASLS